MFSDGYGFTINLFYTSLFINAIMKSVFLHNFLFLDADNLFFPSNPAKLRYAQAHVFAVQQRGAGECELPFVSVLASLVGVCIIEERTTKLKD